MKTFIKSFVTIAAAVSMALATTAVASGVTEINGNSNEIPTLSTQVGTTQNGWKSSTSVKAGDKVAFSLHYYIGYTPSASDVTFFLENLTGRTFNDGDSERVTGRITSSSLNSSNGAVTLNFQDDVKLNLHHVSWQEFPACTNPGCETSLPQSRSKVLTSGGLNVGTIYGGADNNYAGSVVVEFMAQAVTVTPPVTFDAPEVDTKNPTNVDEDSATLNGDVDLTSDVDSGDVFFQWGTSSSNLNRNTNDQARSSDGNFSANISGLQDNTRYYYRAVLDGDNGERYYGSIKNFTTDKEDDEPTSDDVDIDTRSASSVQDDSARLNGRLVSGDNQEVWFAFSELDSTPSCSSSTQRVNVSGTYDGGDSFSKTVTGLDVNTKYYYRACTLDEDGDILSADIEDFVTDEDEDDDRNEDEAGVDTLSESSVDEDSARLNGRVTEGDNADVWFAFARTDSTPSCSANTQRINVSGTYDAGESFSKTVTGLSANTKYYYRACILGDNGDIESGSIESFVTDEDDDEPTTPVVTTNDPVTVTRIPSGVSTNQATLRSFVSGNGAATCYFQYGTSTSYGLTTPAQSVNLDNTGACTSTRFNLQPNTTYYYRSVLVDGGQTYFGLRQSFRTASAPVVTTPRVPVVTTPRVPTTPTPVDNTVTVTVVEQVEQVATGGLQISKFVSSDEDPRFSRNTEVDRNDTVYYKVVVTNNTTEVLEDLTVVDFIPAALELDGRESLDDDSEKELRWRIRSLQPGDSREFITEMRVRDDVRYGSVIDSYASVFNNDISLNSNEVEIDVQEDEVVEETVTQAASIFGAGFLPTTLFGWLGLLAIVLAIAYLVSRILFARNENDRVLEELRAMQQNK